MRSRNDLKMAGHKMKEIYCQITFGGPSWLDQFVRGSAVTLPSNNQVRLHLRLGANLRCTKRIGEGEEFLKERKGKTIRKVAI